MSRAIPSSFNEYLFTTSNPDNLIIDGGIMPLRKSSDPTSTWYKNCLRGEDHIFLGEALDVRCSGYRRTPHKEIYSTYTWELMDSMRSLWNSNSWSSTAPTFSPAVVQDASSWWDYVTQYFSLPSQQSLGDTYTVLDSNQIMKLFMDMKQLNYYVTTGGRGGVCPYSYSQSCTYTVHEEENRPYYQPAPADYDQTSTSYLWYEQEDVTYDDDYPGGIEWRRTYTTNSNSLTFTERTSTPPNLKKTCVEIIPYAEMEVCNYGNTYDGNGHYGDSIYEYKYVVVPLKSGYTDMLNETVPTLSSSEIDTAINLAYSTAGLTKKAVDIPLTPATPPYSGARTYRGVTSTCRIWTLFYIVHFKYCTLEDVTIQ